jgi:hypothetical protein
MSSTLKVRSIDFHLVIRLFNAVQICGLNSALKFIEDISQVQTLPLLRFCELLELCWSVGKATAITEAQPNKCNRKDNHD